MTPGDPRISFVWEGIERAVAAAQEAAGERDVGIFGGSLTQQHLDAGLLDEIVLHIAPVLLGSGVRLFGDEGAEQVELERSPSARPISSPICTSGSGEGTGMGHVSAKRRGLAAASNADHARQAPAAMRPTPGQAEVSGRTWR
jgi:RibD C-terminal domain